ncbi:MAG: pitrilysin family protein [Gemmatimonadota bacterium]|nr:pitrilysin family protein [Gemmatimonadota bacterium]MDE2870578.1 pitrilysin family protein [Gemmatimonadota bacterium]
MTGPMRGDDRRAAPPPGPIRPYEFPAVAEERLSNGMAVRLVSAIGLPVVTAMVVLRAGETAAPVGRGGLAVLAGDGLEGGTTRLSSRELAMALEGIGASYGAMTGWDSTTVAVSCLAEHLPEAMPLVAGMVRSPAFEEAEFDRCRAQRLAAAAQRRMDPASLAADWHARLAYADGGTYARPLGGTESSIGSTEAGDARGFVEARYGPLEAALVIVGDLDSGEALTLAEAHWGDWHREVNPVPEPEAAPRLRSRSAHVVHRPGSVQSRIRVGHMGVSRGVGDYFPLIVLNLVLGGTFSSRLNLGLRERHGFTYGVRSSFAPRRGPGPFAVSTAVANDVTGAAVKEIVREIEAVVEAGPAGEEVESATSYMAGVFPLRLQTTGQIASRIARMIVFGLPEDHYRGYRDRVREVTAAEAAEAARRHIRPDELCTVIVGDADAVAPQLEGLGLGPVTVHEEKA